MNKIISRINIDDKTRSEYKKLTKTERNLMARHGKNNNENSIEYFEELMIDFDKAIELSEMLVDIGLNDFITTPFSVNNLPIVLLGFGIGVSKRQASEIAILYKQPENTPIFKKILNDFNTKKRNTEELELIQDLIWEYVDSKKNYKKIL